MKSSDCILSLINNDINIVITNYLIAQNLKDPLHVNRKHQQRGIKNKYVLIALNYGVKSRTYKDFSYTLNDRVLIPTIYEPYLDILRGLTVVGYWENDVFFLRTSFWNYTIKSRKRY